MNKKRISLIIFGVLAGGVLCLSSIVYVLIQDDKDRCERIYAIADDPQKMGYLRSWVEANQNDPQILKLVGYGGRLDLRNDGDRFSKAEIDWSILGLKRDFAFIQFELQHISKGKELSKPIVHSISFGEFRNRIEFSVSGNHVAAGTSSLSELDRGLSLETHIYCE